jgi:hypothetical protein
MDDKTQQSKSGGKGWLSEVFHDSDVKGIAKFAAFFLILGGLLTTCSIMDSVADRVAVDKDSNQVSGTVPDCTTQTASNVVINNKAYTLTCR